MGVKEGGEVVDGEPEAEREGVGVAEAVSVRVECGEAVGVREGEGEAVPPVLPVAPWRKTEGEGERVKGMEGVGDCV